MKLVAINKKQLVIYERRKIDGNYYLMKCRNLTELFKNIPDGNKAISKTTMENEILRYHIKNMNMIDEADVLTNSKTKFYKFNTIYELYLLIMLNA